MYEFRFLLDRFWVTRAENKDLYFAVKRALPHYRRLVNEQLGWNLIVNEAVVKLEKVPAKAMAWMGIQEFQEKLAQELVAYMAGWMLLEERDEGFLLYPAVGKWIGHYPAGYQGGPGEEKWDEPLEDA